MTIEELLWGSAPVPVVPAPEMNPLAEDDALQEAQLIDLRVHALSSTAALLFELRTALQFDTGNAAVLIVRGLEKSEWRPGGRRDGKTAWSVVGSTVRTGSRSFGIEIDLYPNAKVEVSGASAEFYVVDVPGISEAPPDYSLEGEEFMRSDLPGWDSPFSLLQASRLEENKG
ncbi:hypothetical protein ACIQF6_24245 [Kitasatospora sp. NPDC092948]|uniref:hypothetical protein n=1 Tax=Kitasatospora sp. NPDC092948 TaxID=3364088 RepID=UPI00382B2353